MRTERLIYLARVHLHDLRTPYAFDDTAITEALNEAQRELVSDLAEIGIVAGTEGTGTVSLTAGTMEYALPAGCNLGEVSRVEYKKTAGSPAVTTYTVLRYRNFADIPDTVAVSNTAASVRGTPTEYYLRGGKIGLLPCPDATTATGDPILTLWWTAYATDLASPATDPSVPPAFHHLMPWYAAAILERPLDPATGDFHMAQYLEKKARMLKVSADMVKARSATVGGTRR